MMVTKDLYSRRKLRKVFKKFIEKKGFYDQKYEKNWKSKNGVKTALTPLFKELWAIYVFLKFDDSKNTSVNQRKSKNHEELNFSSEKVQKYEKNRKSKNGKCEFLRPISEAEIGLKKWWSQKTSPRGANWGKFSKKIFSKKLDFMLKNMKKTESPTMTSKVLYELLINS